LVLTGLDPLGGGSPCSPGTSRWCPRPR
jgi:hypothetical protein